MDNDRITHPMLFIFELIGGLEHDLYFPFHKWGVILPIDELIFFKMVIAPPPSYLWIIEHSLFSNNWGAVDDSILLPVGLIVAASLYLIFSFSNLFGATPQK